MKKLLFPALFFQTLVSYSQLNHLSVEKIMRDPKWIGTSPSNPFWTADGKYLLFNWNPNNATTDSVYYISSTATTPQKTTWQFRQAAIADNQIRYNNQHSAYVYAYEGDIYLVNVKTGIRKQITQTSETESTPTFSFNDNKVIYIRDQNAYAWDIATGATTQLINFQTIAAPATTTATQRGNQPPALKNNRSATTGNTQEKWLQQEALENSAVLLRRKQKKDLADSMLKQFIK